MSPSGKGCEKPHVYKNYRHAVYRVRANDDEARADEGLCYGSATINEASLPLLVMREKKIRSFFTVAHLAVVRAMTFVTYLL